MSTPVCYPANPADKDWGIWRDSVLAMLGSPRLYYLRVPNLFSVSLKPVAIWVSCGNTSPWRRGLRIGRSATFAARTLAGGRKEARFLGTRRWANRFCSQIWSVQPQFLQNIFFNTLLMFWVNKLKLQVLRQQIIKQRILPHEFCGCTDQIWLQNQTSCLPYT